MRCVAHLLNGQCDEPEDLTGKSPTSASPVSFRRDINLFFVLLPLRVSYECVAQARGYPQTMQAELQPLLTSGANWARFYEFWGWAGADYGVRSALNLTRLGVPLVMHAYPGRAGPDDITMAVATFLLVQTEHCYFGTSVGGKGYTPWDDPAYVLHTCWLFRWALMTSSLYCADGLGTRCTTSNLATQRAMQLTMTRHQHGNGSSATRSSP